MDGKRIRMSLPQMKFADLDITSALANSFSRRLLSSSESNLGFLGCALTDQFVRDLDTALVRESYQEQNWKKLPWIGRCHRSNRPEPVFPEYPRGSTFDVSDSC